MIYWHRALPIPSRTEGLEHLFKFFLGPDIRFKGPEGDQHENVCVCVCVCACGEQQTASITALRVRAPLLHCVCAYACVFVLCCVLLSLFSAHAHIPLLRLPPSSRCLCCAVVNCVLSFVAWGFRCIVACQIMLNHVSPRFEAFAELRFII